VDLNDIKPSLHSPPRSISERLLERLDILKRHLFRLGVLVIPRDRTRRIHVVWPPVEILTRDLAAAQPRRYCGSLAAGVCELNHDLLALAVSEVDDLLERGDLAVFPYTDIFGRDAALRRYSGGFDAGDTWAALDDACVWSLVRESIDRGLLCPGTNLPCASSATWYSAHPEPSTGKAARA